MNWPTTAQRSQAQTLVNEYTLPMQQCLQLVMLGLTEDQQRKCCYLARVSSSEDKWLEAFLLAQDYAEFNALAPDIQERIKDDWT